MTTFILDDESEQTTLGEFLESAGDRVIELRLEDGTLVATIVLSRDDLGVDYEALVAEAERNIDEIRRRMQEPLSKAITTDQLLQRLESSTSGT
jgi:hypothetical protein